MVEVLYRFQYPSTLITRNVFLQDFFKLMNNGVFGKTQENLRKRSYVELITDDRILRNRLSNLIFVCAIRLHIV